MTNARQLSENSRVQMAEVIVALIQGKAPKQIATELQVPYSRIIRWQKDPEFLELYEQTEAELLARVKTEAAEFINARLDVLGPKALDVLEEGLGAEKMSDRLSAAKAVLAFKGVGKTTREAQPSSNVVPVEARIKAKAVDASPLAGD